jgi:two-component system, OmpR family, sensor histidine kinase CreC
MKIRVRLIIGFVLIAGAGFFYLADWIIKELRPHYLRAIEESLVDSSTLLASWLSAQMNSDTINSKDLRQAFTAANKRAFEAKIYDLIKTSMRLRAYVTDQNGIVVFDSDSGRDEGKSYALWNNVKRTLDGHYGARSTRRDPKDPNSAVLHVSSPVIHAGKIAGVLTIAKPADSVVQFIENAKLRIFSTILFAAFGVLVFIILLSLWITEPIRRITLYVRNVRKDRHMSFPKLHFLGVLGRNEMDELGDALIEMRETLEKKQYAERYVQNLTHEIKSPLSAIRGAAEIIDEKMPAHERTKFIANIRTETERIQHIVDCLLELAAIENRSGLKSVEKINITEFIKEISESYHVVAAAKGIKIASDIPEKMTLVGERFLLRQAVANLLQNAIDFSHPGGTIEIRAHEEGDKVVIAIHDEGAGIPEYALPRIFERFYSLNRPDTNLRSTGLGLSFVKEAAELHGGSITITNNTNKPGVTAALILPVQSSN